MDAVIRKLDNLTQSAVYDVCMVSCNGNSGGRMGRLRDPAAPFSRWIYPAHVPGKGEVGILKVLQSNVCRNHCSYCAFAAHRNTERHTLTPDELARIYISLYRSGSVYGLFLSTGILNDPDSSMDRMIATADLLRRRYRYTGYIHIKLLPGSSAGAVHDACMLADRVSLNLESPKLDQLTVIAPEKRKREEFLGPLKEAGRYIRAGGRVKSQTTQFVVGIGKETDAELLNTSVYLYNRLRVFRSYFSAYQPVDSPAVQPVQDDVLLREHRLYQSDYLVREYGFSLNEMIFDRQGMLPGQTDPKTAWALMNPGFYPVEVNSADREVLLRVPGIGPASADRIIESRKNGKLRGPEDLKHTGAWISRAAGYLEFAGKPGGEGRYRQLELFSRLQPPEWRKGIPT
ncbi:MAG: radical SAM protein [Spirochaetia bacterium]